jgi:hypothetical protein
MDSRPRKIFAPERFAEKEVGIGGPTVTFTVSRDRAVDRCPSR